MEMPEVKATWGKHNECNFPYWVSCDVGDVHFTAGMNTEQQARLIADRINTDPAEIEARLRRKLWEEVSRLELVPDNTAGYTGPTMRARYDERTLKAVLEIMEGDSK